METKETVVMFEQLYRFKTTEQWDQCFVVAHKIEKNLLTVPESRSILKCYMELFHLYYLKGELSKAIHYFTLLEPLIVQYGTWEDYTKFMQSVVKTALFYVRRKEIESFTDQLIPLAFEQEQYEVLSNSFLLKSYIHLADEQIELSTQEAKIAYFYAQLVDEEKREFVLCNAQLQLVITFIEKIAIEDAQYYIEEFGWSREACKNDGELILVSLVESMVQILNHQFKQSLPLVKKVLTVLSHSNEIMYSTILSRQMKSVLKKVEHQLPKDVYIELTSLCEQVLSRFKMTQNVFMNKFVAFNKNLTERLEQKFEKPTNIIYVGQKLFDEAVKQNATIYCMITKLNYMALPEQEKEQFNQYLKDYKKILNNQQLVVSQFSPQLLIILAKVEDHAGVNQEQLKKFNCEGKYHSMMIDYNPADRIFSNFHQLLNHAHYNKLLEIKLESIK